MMPDILRFEVNVSGVVEVADHGKADSADF